MKPRNVKPNRSLTPIANDEKSHDLVRRLGSRDDEVRHIAQEEFVRIATDDPSLFHADLADIIRAITGNRRRSSIAIASSLGIAYLFYMISMILSSVIPRGNDIFLVELCFVAAVIPLGLTSLGISKAVLGPRRKRLAECITEIDELNALPALIELLEFGNPAVRIAILSPITRLLLRVRASDAHLLGFLHRSVLARTLSTPRTHRLPSSFFVGILQAFEHIGDSQALPAVTWLAEGKGVAQTDETVQEAAQKCLAHLQAQLSRQQAPYLLLRPSSLADAPQILLRPVVSAPDSAPNELLRADNSPSVQTPLSAYCPNEAEAELLPIRLQRHENL